QIIILSTREENVSLPTMPGLIAYRLAEESGANAQIMVTLAAALFMLPYLLFSATAGQLADKYDRSKLARITKLWELVIVSIAAVGFYISSMYFLLFVLFCLGIQATFFGPIKFALLPQHLHENELVEGNAYINAGSFIAILLGTITGGLIIMHEHGNHFIAIGMVGVALLGYAASRFIPPATPAQRGLKLSWNLAAVTWEMVKHDREHPRVFRCILGISWFWLVGATFLSQFPTLAKDVLHADEGVVTLFLTMFSVGIAIGSFVCNWLLKGEVKSTYVPYAAWGLSAFIVDLFFASSAAVIADEGTLMSVGEFLSHAANWRVAFDLLMVSVSAGLYIVPLYAIMQHDSDPQFRARTIASNNIVNALFMVLAGLATMGMLAAHFTVPEVFLTIGVLNAAVAWYISRL
ncbi:MAG: MFS transporter, partial [Rickettsiales bacterium]|nr:MFS transporter [Rickettsiales bacterium]